MAEEEVHGVSALGQALGSCDDHSRPAPVGAPRVQHIPPQRLTRIPCSSFSLARAADAAAAQAATGPLASGLRWAQRARSASADRSAACTQATTRVS